MKKLLGIVVLGLLWCSVGYTKEENKYYLDHPYLERFNTLMENN